MTKLKISLLSAVAAMAISGCGGASTYSDTESFSVRGQEDKTVSINIGTRESTTATTTTEDNATTDTGTGGIADTGTTEDVIANTDTTATSGYGITKQPEHGTAELAYDTIHYTPDKGFVGTDKMELEYGTEEDLDYRIIKISINVTDENQAPVISGIPTTIVAEGEKYSFTPNTTDQDGDTLKFGIANKPKWATFDVITGTMEGNASIDGAKIDPDTFEATFPDIKIFVTDGLETAVMDSFTIEVI